MDRATLIHRFEKNPVSLLRILANKVNYLRSQVRVLALDLEQHQQLSQELTLRHYQGKGVRAVHRETISNLGNQIAAAHGGSITPMSAECTAPLLQQYAEILEESDPAVRAEQMAHFAEQYIPSLMVTLADLNELRCPDDDISTWVTEQEMNARQYIYPFSDPLYPET